MTETAVRDLMRQAMAGDEPAMGPVLGRALRAARRARRQRLAASATAGAAMAVCLVVGLSVVGGPGNGPQRHDLASDGFVFVRPALSEVTYTQIRPITSAYLGRLLVADLPPGARHSQVEASANANIPGATARTASASFGVVTTSAGSGYVMATMMAVGATDTGFGCARGLDRGHCRAYSLAGRVTVVEEYSSATVATTHQQVMSFSVQVFRPRVALVSLKESNEAATAGSPVAGSMPIEAAQLLAAALDPRWQFYVIKALSGAGSGRGMLM
jgi:hypothetical protein